MEVHFVDRRLFLSDTFSLLPVLYACAMLFGVWKKSSEKKIRHLIVYTEAINGVNNYWHCLNTKTVNMFLLQCLKVKMYYGNNPALPSTSLLVLGMCFAFFT